MNLKKIQKKIDDYFNSPESEIYFNRLIRSRERNKKWMKQVHRRICEDPNIMERIVKWEIIYMARYYKRGIETSSNIFGVIKSIYEENGIDVYEDCDEDFISSAYTYLGYTIKTYCGQGCFNRIYNKKGECIL